MKRTFVLNQSETLTAIARGVVEEHMPKGEWTCSVDIDINVSTRRVESCVVTVEAKAKP